MLESGEIIETSLARVGPVVLGPIESPESELLEDEEDEETYIERHLIGSVTSCSSSGSLSPQTNHLSRPSASPHSSSESSALSTGSLGISNCSPIEKRHLCDICGKAFSYQSILESHRRCHTGEKPFKCTFCDKKFAQKATLQVHERTHTGERPYKCKYCEKTFAQYGTKTVHEKSAHLGIRNYKCPKCDKSLSSPSALYTHKKTHGEKTFQCPCCPKTFTLKNYLKLHVKQVHEQNERKHSCRFCPKSFAYAGSLQVHIRTHTGERPYICQYCPKAFASQGNLQSHERTHTGEKPYTCKHCNRAFIQKSQLTAHEATHSLLPGTILPDENDNSVVTVSPVISIEEENKSTNCEYSCEYCGKKYAYQSSLNVHIRQHTGEQPYRCQYCNKRFNNQGNMLVHERVHTGEKPYSCICGKSYTQKVGLRIHTENCKTHLDMEGRVSESPINVDTDSDSSEEVRKTFVPVPNIYQNSSPTSHYVPQVGPATEMQLPTMTTVTSTIQFPSVQMDNTFKVTEIATSDYGPPTANQPSFHSDVILSDSFSAFAPVKLPEPQPTVSSQLLDSHLLLKSLLDQSLSAALLPPPSATGHSLLSQQLLNASLLLQLQSNTVSDSLTSLLQSLSNPSMQNLQNQQTLPFLPGLYQPGLMSMNTTL